MRNVIRIGFVCVVIAVCQATASAQPGSVPYTQPTVSPYMNLARRGSSTAVDYFGLIRPQLEFRSALRSLEQQSTNNSLNAAQATDPQTGLPSTGHTAMFLNTGGYFMNNLAGAAQGGRGPQAAAQRRGVAPAATARGYSGPRH